MNWRYTIGWLALGLGFLGLEIMALFDADPGDTLSENIWWLLDIHPIIWWLAAGFSVWLTRHLMFRKK